MTKLASAGTPELFLPSSQIGVGGLELGPKEKEYLSQVIASNRLSYGPFSQKFEAGFAAAHDCRFAVFCNSGTSALHLALAALKERHGWSDGDEVLVPSVTFVATANIVFHNGMRPVFVDVEPDTFNMDPRLIEARITPRTRAIIPVHLLGLPCDMDPILEIARRRGLRVIEDSCETTFASYKGRKVGSLGDVGCFSTYIAHYLVTGVGGLATTNDPDLAVRLRSLMNHGRDSIYLKIDDDQGVPRERLQEIVAKRFSFVSMGHSFRCTELEAAIGLAQLEGKDAVARARRSNARFLLDGLADLGERLQLAVVPPGRDHMFMMFPIVVRDGDKTGLIRYLEERLIETRDLLPLINQPIYRKIFGDLEQDYPVARRLNRAAFYIGCHQYLSRQELEFVVDAIHQFFTPPSRAAAPRKQEETPVSFAGAVRDASETAREFREKGYVFLRGLLSPEETRRWVERLQELSGLGDRDFDAQKARLGGWNLPDGVGKLEDWWPLIFHPRLLAAARGVLGPGARYVQHSDLQVHHGTTGWHRECVHRVFGVGPDWDESREPYAVARVALYLQDFASSGFSAGFVPGSHRRESLLTRAELRAHGRLGGALGPGSSLPLVSVRPDWIRAEAGDCAIFDPRVLHSESPVHGPKYAVYLSYGADNEHSRRHGRYYLRERRDLGYEELRPELRRRLREERLLLEP